jgi:multiple sugar transport system substrate-binding protein
MKGVKRMSKFLKRITCLAVVMFVIIVINGCGGNTAKDVSTSSQKPEKVNLTLWHYFDGVMQQKTIEDLAQKFNASQDKITVKMEYAPRGELLKQLTIGLVADKLPDIVVLDNPDTPSFAAMGILADLTDKINAPEMKKDDYYPGPLKSNLYNDKYYGIPVGSNDIALFYNEDMLKAAGITAPPKTWDELQAAAKKLSKDGVYGLAMCALKNEEGTFQFLPWLISSGGNYNKLDSPESIKAFQFLTTLVNEGSLSKESINWTQADVEKQFATGKAAMMINGPWNVEHVKGDAPNLKFSVVKMPKDKVWASCLGGENFSIIKGHHEAEAWEFVKFALSEGNLAAMLDVMGYIPSRKDIAESDQKLKNDPIMSVFVDEMQYAMPRGPNAKWPEYSEAIYTALQESLTNQKTPEQAAHDAQLKAEKILKSN